MNQRVNVRSFDLSRPLYFPGKTLSKEKVSASVPPDRATALLSPCRLTGCRVTDRSSQDARGQPEDIMFIWRNMQKGVMSLGVWAPFQTKTCVFWKQMKHECPRPYLNSRLFQRQTPWIGWKVGQWAAGPQGRPPGPEAAEPGLPSPLTRGATPGAVEIQSNTAVRNLGWFFFWFWVLGTFLPTQRSTLKITQFWVWIRIKRTWTL